MKKVVFIALMVPLMLFQACNSKEKPGKEVVPVVDDNIVSASYSPDGKKILIAHKKYVLIYDATTGTVLKKIPEKTEKEELIEKIFTDSSDNIKKGK